MTRYLLAFDTSSDDIVLSVACLARSAQPELVAAQRLAAARAANTQLLPLIEETLQQAQISRDQLAAIAVGVTLGSYTGVRIGLATAKGIAGGLNIPLYGLATDPDQLQPQHLLDCFASARAQQSGDPSTVVPQYQQLSYAEEAERDQYPQRYEAPCYAQQASPAVPVLTATPCAAVTPSGDASKAPLILGIETSCDETAAAVMAGRELRSNVIASQVVFHTRFGGVVPEIASRKHTEAIVATVDEALRQAQVTLPELTAIAVTDRPGLIGALVVGQAYAKGLAWALQIPLYGINHLEGHLYSCVIEPTAAEAAAQHDSIPDLPVAYVALIVSGGHTMLLHAPRPFYYETLGETLDDAAGEAFDKVAKVLGLGYPGGPILSKLAQSGDARAIDFPRAMLHSKDYDFSLSGLKTAVITYIREREGREGESVQSCHIPDIAASFQQAIIDVQVAKAVRAVQETGVKHFILAGGVAANTALRSALTSALAAVGVTVLTSPLTYCGDNAAMIARAAVARLESGDSCDTALLAWDADAASTGSLDTRS
ncbi:MAG: tRNA (adenosine(37)-N6)-threonylcarbamoyltransferase complex transferase subunit TsaD [Coriobacteriia bacterium]|nr:tRNA (adenosine(37)-N6)-threonylcarbamoyltransferase complex transferase subunit TsaD [Coriobacteriia bacterium]